MAPRCRSALSTSAKSKSTGRRPARRPGIQPRRCQAWTVAGLTWRRSASCVAVKYSFIEVPSELQTDSRYMSSYSGICARSSVTESGFVRIRRVFCCSVNSGCFGHATAPKARLRKWPRAGQIYIFLGLLSAHTLRRGLRLRRNQRRHHERYHRLDW
jgi:hypothetical protein